MSPRSGQPPGAAVEARAAAEHDAPDRTGAPRVLRTETLASTRIFHIEQVDLQFASGVTARYERLMGSEAGAVLVVPMLDADTVLLIREYAVGFERYELGLPKGRIEDGELPETAADREMMEEIGYGARQLRVLRSLTLAPAYFRHVTHVVLAEGLYECRRPGDEPEPLEVVPWRLSHLDELLRHGECTCARSIAALFLVREALRP